MKKSKIIAALLAILICTALLCGCVRQKPEDGADFSEHSELGIEKKERKTSTSDSSDLLLPDSPEGQDEAKNADAPDASSQAKK